MDYEIITHRFIPPEERRGPMSLSLIYWPNNLLRQTSNQVEVADIGLFSQFVDDLIKTMYENNGVGISAIQVGNNIRLFVLDIGLGPEVYFNPVVDYTDGDEASLQEGCLSVPGFYENIVRFTRVKGHAFNKNGEMFRFEELAGTDEQQNYRAHVIQHEAEHLDGKIFLDHLSQGKRDNARQHMKKFKSK
jgi:peptide deformylase